MRAISCGVHLLAARRGRAASNVPAVHAGASQQHHCRSVFLQAWQAAAEYPGLLAGWLAVAVWPNFVITMFLCQASSVACPGTVRLHAEHSVSRQLRLSRVPECRGAVLADTSLALHSASPARFSSCTCSAEDVMLGAHALLSREQQQCWLACALDEMS